MKWFQQNRALGTLLIVSGSCILVGAALLDWRWSVWSNAKQGFEHVTAERNRLQALDPFPNETNYRKLQSYLETYKAALDTFKNELKAEVAPAPPLPPNEFQSRLRQATLAAEDRARMNNVKLPVQFQLGFDEFARTMPDTAVATLLGQELSQVQMLINILLDAKVDSITSFRRRPLSEERGASATPTPSPERRVATAAKARGAPTPKLIERNVVEISFKAAPGAARKVVNEITSSAGQLFIIRTLYVHNEKDKGPPRERTGAPTPAPNPQASPGQGAGALNFIVGNEHVEVSATIEMLRFTF